MAVPEIGIRGRWLVIVFKGGELAHVADGTPVMFADGTSSWRINFEIRRPAHVTCPYVLGVRHRERLAYTKKNYKVLSVPMKRGWEC